MIKWARKHSRREEYKQALHHIHSYQRDNKFDLEAMKMETASRVFFKTRTSKLRRISIEEIETEQGVSTDPAQISTHFLNHWGSIFNDPESPGYQETTTVETSQDVLINSIKLKLDVEEEHQLN